MSVNLAPLSMEVWKAAATWCPSYWDTTVTHNGNPSIRNEGVQGKTRELNARWTAVKAGDIVFLSAWMKINPSNLGTTAANRPQSGARIGIDFYGASGRLTGISYDPHGSEFVIPEPSSGTVANFVPYDSDWTYREITVKIPPSFNATPITGLIAWYGVMTNRIYGTEYYQNELATGWLSETVLYINPGAITFKCELCGAVFNTQAELDAHTLELHTFICQICHIPFNTQAELNEHIALVHPPIEWIIQAKTEPPTEEWKITVKPYRIGGWL